MRNLLEVFIVSRLVSIEASSRRFLDVFMTIEMKSLQARRNEKKSAGWEGGGRGRGGTGSLSKNVDQVR